MSFELDPSIRDDYLVEAGEIVDQLGSELVQLERSPEDGEILNSVFRAFHTIKGGAGFLSLDPLVELCHCAEELFDGLRRGQDRLDPDRMDAVLQALDQVASMLAAVGQGVDPQPAPPELVQRLAGKGEAPAEPAPREESATEPESADAAELEFEAMMGNVSAGSKPGGGGQQPAAAAGSDEITEDEFDALLDEMQRGGGETPPVGGDGTSPEPEPSAANPAMPVAEAPSDAGAPASRAAAASGGGESTVRVAVSSLDSLMNLVGELVLVRNRLTNLGGRLKDEELDKAVGNLDMVTADLQSGVMQTRMQPIRKVFSRFPRLARDVGRSLGKEIELELIGEETDLDKNLVEALADPLVHLVRNSMDHGIESPAEREARGKPRAGRVQIAAEQQGDRISISVRDDGAGIDPEKLREKAVKKGLISAEAAEKLGHGESLDLIFMPGFSTREEVSDISGRGVGMDVVKSRIGKLNGTVEIESQVGSGSCIRVEVPLTLAILPTLMVRIGERTYAFPLSHVLEVILLEPEKIHRVSGQEVVMVRGKPLQLVNLPRALFGQASGEAPAEDDRCQYVVVLQVGSAVVGFMTSDVLGQEEVVIKPLGGLLENVSQFAGATITGDGCLALIFDVDGLMEHLSADAAGRGLCA